MGCTGLHLFLSHSTKRGAGTKEGGYVRSKAPVTSPLTNGFPATGGLVLSHVPLKQQSEQESSQAPHTGMLPGAPQRMTCEAPHLYKHTLSPAEPAAPLPGTCSLGL